MFLHGGLFDGWNELKHIGAETTGVRPTHACMHAYAMNLHFTMLGLHIWVTCNAIDYSKISSPIAFLNQPI